VRQFRVYVDTSVFGGTEDEEFREPSRRFFERVRCGEYKVIVSPVTYGELQQAPDALHRVVDDLPEAAVEHVALSQEARELAQAYVDAGVVSESSLGDTAHVATATVARADLIVSWNFRHIVNFDRIRKFNAVNLMMGYPMLSVCSPMEVAYGDQDESL